MSAGGQSTRDRSLEVPVAAFRRTVGHQRTVDVTTTVSDLAAVGVSVPEDAPVVVDLDLVSFAGGITATGRIETTWQGECRRCGGPVDGTVAVDVHERFVPADASSTSPARGGRTTPRTADPATTGDDDEAYPYEGDALDLAPLVRDAILLELPLAPLCREDCQGICPTCGANRNEVHCACQPPADPRWSALDALRES